VVYLGTGLTFTDAGEVRPLASRALPLRPHAAAGLGWKWFPEAGGADLGRAFTAFADPRTWPLALVGLAVIPMIFLGRIELRYTAAPLGDGFPGAPDMVSLVAGIGA
jgi:hypothetical protein